MAHKKKENAASRAAYKADNEAFLDNLRRQPDVHELRCGVLYRVLKAAPDPAQESDERRRRKLEAKPSPRTVVTVHYTGRLIDGRQFDSSRRGAGTPVAFRVNELITGWQVALVNMRIGDQWELYVPAEAGYGERGAGRDIPGNSTLIFQLELLDIA